MSSPQGVSRSAPRGLPWLEGARHPWETDPFLRISTHTLGTSPMSLVLTALNGFVHPHPPDSERRMTRNWHLEALGFYTNSTQLWDRKGTQNVWANIVTKVVGVLNTGWCPGQPRCHNSWSAEAWWASRLHQRTPWIASGRGTQSAGDQLLPERVTTAMRRRHCAPNVTCTWPFHKV